MEVQNMVYIIIAAVIGGIILFIKSYTKKKAENLADQQYSKEIEKIKNESSISSSIDTQLLRLLITANDAIRKEHQDYYLRGCGSAFDDVYALSEYLVKFNVRYSKDKDAKVIIDANDDFYNLDKASECNGGLEEPRYYKVLARVQQSIQNLLDKRLPKSK